MNIPNRITLIRIILLPFMVFFYLADFMAPWGKLVAFILFVLAAMTDKLDGYLARKLNQTTVLGNFLDTNADKLLTNIALLLVICDGTIPAPWGVIAGIIYVGRDIVICALKELAATKNHVFKADNLGRIKATFQMIGIPAFIFVAFLRQAVENATVILVFEIIAYVTFAIATALTIISMINYLVKNRHFFKENES